jgi:16S rRNA (adenine1518-N6/adenine1519-N6)-dimethyltransferase
MSSLLGARRVRELLSAHGIHPTKTLGQNFVIDPNTIRKVVSVAGVGATDSVLEIGAGLGSLTLELARVARSVTAIEVDARIVPALREVLAGAENVEVVNGDALAVELGSFGATHVVANLPYNIAAPVVLRILETAPSIRRLTVMTQKEVGERLAAPPGSKTYGAPSVLVAYWGAARVAAPVSRRAFYPEPNVDSVVVVVDRRDELPDVDRATLFAVIKASFSQRRKTMRNSLADVSGSTSSAEAALAAAGVDPMARPEQLDLDAFVEVASQLVPTRHTAV